MSLFEIRLKIVELLLRKCDYQMIVHQKTSKGHLGAIQCCVPDEEAKNHIVKIIKQGLSSEVRFRDLYLAGAEAYRCDLLSEFLTLRCE